MNMENFDLRLSASKKILLVAHRGTFGGNLPFNTIPAYELALSHGADMLEIDVDRTADGKLVIFHPHMERRHLGWSGSIRECDWDFVKQLRYTNADHDPTQFGVELLDDVLDRFKGRCYINVDKYWENPEAISKAIRDHGMTEQIVVKSTPDERVLSITEQFCSDMQFMAIISKPEELARCMGRNIRLIGSEVLFASEESPLASKEFIAQQHKQNLLVWVNSIVYNYKVQLAGGHSDDRAVCGDPEGSWGWLADRGFDFIQTDWILAASKFLTDTGRMARCSCV